MVHIKIKSFKGKKLQPLNNFFNKVFRDVIKIDTQYNKFTSDHTFAYKERQLNTSLLPALQMNANAILHEQPIKRKRKETEGRIDFWICKKNYDIFLEVKHGYQNKKLINKNIKDKWKEITNQLNKIKKRSVNERKTLEHNLVYTIGLLFWFIHKKARNMSNIPKPIAQK